MVEERVFLSKQKLDQLGKKHGELVNNLPRHRALLQQAIESGGGTHDNALYDQAKGDLELIERQVADIGRLLARATVIAVPLDSNIARIGSKVIVQDCDSEKRRTIIVAGYEETDLATNRYSYLSPLVQSIMGQRVGSTVDFAPPKGDKIRYLILEVNPATLAEIGGTIE